MAAHPRPSGSHEPFGADNCPRMTEHANDRNRRPAPRPRHIACPRDVIRPGKTTYQSFPCGTDWRTARTAPPAMSSSATAGERTEELSGWRQSVVQHGGVGDADDRAL